MLKVGPDISPLAYFSQVKDDASKITWERGVNSKAALDKALKSKYCGCNVMSELDELKNLKWFCNHITSCSSITCNKTVKAF